MLLSLKSVLFLCRLFRVLLKCYPRMKLILRFRLRKRQLLIQIRIKAMNESKNWVKITLELIKLIVTALLGYFGGNAIV